MTRAAFLLFIFLTPAFTLFASDSPLSGRVIVLDPGHGVINYDGRVINSGKINDQGQMEHKLNMEIARKAGALLEQGGAKVFYTRTWEDYWRESYGTVEDNKSRAVFTQEVGADVFISIHCDWYPLRKFRGVTTFYAKPESRRLGQLIHQSMVTRLKARDRKLVFDSYTVLDNAAVPAVLMECGFLSNREEARLLARPSYQLDIARAILSALEIYFGELRPVTQTNN